jgi:hypothetical protein
MCSIVILHLCDHAETPPEVISFLPTTRQQSPFSIATHDGLAGAGNGRIRERDASLGGTSEHGCDRRHRRLKGVRLCHGRSGGRHLTIRHAGGGESTVERIFQIEGVLERSSAYGW